MLEPGGFRPRTHLQIGMATGLGIPWHSGEGGDRSVGLRRGREQPHHRDNCARDGGREAGSGDHRPTLRLAWATAGVVALLGAFAVHLVFVMLLVMPRRSLRREVAATAERSGGAGREGGWRRAAGAVALVGGGAGRRRRGGGEAAAGAGVIDLVEEAVVIGGDKRLVGAEVDIGAVGADPDQPRGSRERKNAAALLGRIAGTRGDQLGATVDVLIDVLERLVSAWTRASSVLKKTRPSFVMKRPSWLPSTFDVGGAPLGRQETQTILPVEGSYVYISRWPCCCTETGQPGCR